MDFDLSLGDPSGFLEEEDLEGDFALAAGAAGFAASPTVAGCSALAGAGVLWDAALGVVAGLAGGGEVGKMPTLVEAGVEVGKMPTLLDGVEGFLADAFGFSAGVMAWAVGGEAGKMPTLLDGAGFAFLGSLVVGFAGWLPCSAGLVPAVASPWRAVMVSFLATGFCGFSSTDLMSDAGVVFEACLWTMVKRAGVRDLGTITQYRQRVVPSGGAK